MTKPLDLTGQKFGKLLVVRRSEKRTKAMKAMFDCVCDCGNQKTVTGRNLVSGASQSCGCGVAKSAVERFTKHGRTKHPMYSRYNSMMARCYDEKNWEYANYGGRGITVCDRWVDSIDNFIADMGEPPTKEHSIDRVDNDKGYSPENCRWATKKQQSENRRVTYMFTMNGVTKSAADWSRDLGMTKKGVLFRIASGWSLEAALTTPKTPKGKYDRKKGKP